jgi:preprotein translocase subunit SecG
MGTALLALHVFVSLGLIFIVLVQGGKGADLGAAFGAGSSQTLFGGRGAATFLGKMTTAVAIIFMVTSLMLAVFNKQNTSIVTGAPQAPAAQSAPLGAPTGSALPTADEGAPLQPAIPAETAK